MDLQVLVDARRRLGYKLWGPVLAPWRRPSYSYSKLTITNGKISPEVQRHLMNLRDELTRDGTHFINRPEPDLDTVLAGFDSDCRRLNIAIQQVVLECGKTGADVGTAYGWAPLILKRVYGFNVVGTEILQRIPIYSTFALAQGLEIRPWRIPDTPPPFPAQSLDFVLFTEVLEHLKLSPYQVMLHLKDMLRAEGKLILSTPNVHRLDNFQKLLAGQNIIERYREDIPPGADPTDYVSHVREYTISEVVQTVQDAGFAVTKILMCDKTPYYRKPVPVPPQWNAITTVVARKL